MVESPEDRNGTGSSHREVAFPPHRGPFLALLFFALTSTLLSLTVCAGTVHPRPATGETPSASTLAGPEISFRIEVGAESDDLEDPWDLVLYIDGRPVVVVPPKIAPKEFSCPIQEGDHRLRVLRERHAHRSDGSPIHAAEVSNAYLDLHIGSETPTTVAALYRIQEGVSDPPAASLELHRDPDRGSSKVVESPEWELLCEELKVGRRHPDARTLSRGHVLPRCVRWNRLWPEETTVPSRDEARELVVRMEPGAPGDGCRTGS